MNLIAKLLQFLLSVFSEEDGSGSASRVLAGLVVVTCCGCIIFLVVRNHAFPDFGGITGFLTAACGILYGVNKASAAYVNGKAAPPASALPAA